MNVDFQKIARKDKRTFLNEQCKEIEKKIIKRKKPEICSRKLELLKEHFVQR